MWYDLDGKGVISVLRCNRDFLVPYLQNICSLYFARNRLERWRWDAWQELDRCRVTYMEPSPPVEKRPVGFFLGMVALLLFLGSCIWVTIGSPHEGDKLARWVFVVLFVLCLVCLIRKAIAVEEQSAKQWRAYNEEVDKYKKRYQSELATVNQERIRLKKCMDSYQREMNRIDALLEKMYSVNIIPSMYRNSYAAVYLYDWFSNGASDDLDHALSMYVLEQIKSRLDQIIANQSEMILNQSMMMSNQVRSMEQRREYENKMLSKVNRLQATSDERLRYTQMIASNSAALNFFATANYLRNN